ALTIPRTSGEIARGPMSPPCRAGWALPLLRPSGGEGMKIRLLSAAMALALAIGIGAPARGAALPKAGPNTRVTADATAGSYLRYDGASDDTTAACSTGRRSQNEPSVAVDPRDTSVVVA